MAVVQTDSEGTFSANTTWGNASNWPVGGVPLAGEVGLLKAAGASEGVDGVDTTLTGASKMDELRVAPDWLGSIGSSGNPLIFDANVFRYGSNSKNEAHVKGDFTDVILEHSSLETDALVLTDRSGGITNIWAHRGRTKLDGAITATNLRIVPVIGDDANLIVTVESAGTLTLLEMRGGRCTYKSSVTLPTLNLFSGLYEHQQGTLTAAKVVAPGAELVMKGGAITTVYVFAGGKLDLSQSYSDKTITNLFAFDGATVDLQNFAGTNLVTNLHEHGSPVIRKNSGTIIQV